MNESQVPVPDGYRVATYGDKATHAICVHHHRLLPIEADDHTCSWLRLMKNASDQHLAKHDE